MSDGIVTKRVIGPSMGWKNNHFLPFAPNWADIANDVDPKVAAQIRKQVEDAQKKAEDEKKKKQPPSVKDVRIRLFELVSAHEKRLADSLKTNDSYPILCNGDNPRMNAQAGNSSDLSQAMFRKEMKDTHAERAPGRKRKK